MKPKQCCWHVKCGTSQSLSTRVSPVMGRANLRLAIGRCNTEEARILSHNSSCQCLTQILWVRNDRNWLLNNRFCTFEQNSIFDFISCTSSVGLLVYRDYPCCTNHAKRPKLIVEQQISHSWTNSSLISFHVHPL
jgi:hypothetical protein